MAEYHELNKNLEIHSDLLLQTGDAFRVADREAVELQLACDVKKAQTLLMIRTNPDLKSLTVDEKKAHVIVLCQAEIIAAAIAGSEVDSLKMRAKTVEGSLSALQSQVKLALADHTLDGRRT